MENKKKIRHFSEDFKKEKVKLIEEKQLTVSQVSKIYEVSQTAVRKWLKKYSMTYKKSERIVVEKESEGFKTLQLLKQVAELERVIGQKQLEIEFLKKILEFGNKSVGFDIRKKYLSGHLSGSESIVSH
ncbi:MAG: transposase [Bacteroidales bacterium]|nr:transposase [Bacteroidales bacterium]